MNGELVLYAPSGEGCDVVIIVLFLPSMPWHLKIHKIGHPQIKLCGEYQYRRIPNEQHGTSNVINNTRQTMKYNVTQKHT